LLTVVDQISEEPLDQEGRKRKRERNKRISAPKRMANPFSVDLSPDLGLVDPTQWFTHPKSPLHIDIGCAKGRCIERLSQREERAQWNHLGVEIRPATVNEAIDRVKDSPNYQLAQQKNLHFLACNFVVSIDQLLGAFPPEALRLISIQVGSFPDVSSSPHLLPSVPRPLEKKEAFEENAGSRRVGLETLSTFDHWSFYLSLE
jgi:hypothetical protein